MVPNEEEEEDDDDEVLGQHLPYVVVSGISRFFFQSQTVLTKWVSTILFSDLRPCLLYTSRCV